MLRRVSFLPRATLETFYYKTVIPSILHDLAVWGSCSDHLLKDLELIHLRAARLIHKLPKDMEDEIVLMNRGLKRNNGGFIIPLFPVKNSIITLFQSSNHEKKNIIPEICHWRWLF